MIAAGVNVGFMVLTGSECAEKEDCGKSPGYNDKNSQTARTGIDPA